MTEHYRVETDGGHKACEHCGHGGYWTIFSGEGDDEIGIGTSWSDKETADDICDLMNMAYEAGREKAND